MNTDTFQFTFAARLRVWLAAFALASACASDFESAESYDTSADVVETALSRCSPSIKPVAGKRPCMIGAAPKDACFARVREYVGANYPGSTRLSGIAELGEGAHFQYVDNGAGPVGVYCHPRRTAGRAHAVYGAILDHWAEQGWERGSLGYPTSDEYDVAEGRQQSFEVQELGEPDYERGCLIEIHHYLTWDRSSGAVHQTEESMYLDHNTPGQWATTPRQVTQYWPLYAVRELDWCGEPPASRYDDDYVPPVTPDDV